jgi:purine-cytosine permease-like protein
MAIIFGILAVTGIVNHEFVLNTKFAGFVPLEIAGLVSFGGAIFGFAIGWASYAADYNVNQPESTSSARVFWLTALGIFIPCTLLEILGVVLGEMGAPTFVSDTGTLLSTALAPLALFGKVLVFLMALSIVANNIPNDYSLGLSVQVLGKTWQKVPRYIWTLIGAVVYVILALLAAGHFNSTLETFLLLVAYWLAPFSIVLIIEHFFIRKKFYNVEDWNTPGKLPLGWAALTALVAGLFGALLGFAQVLPFVVSKASTVLGLIEITPASSIGISPITGIIGGLYNSPFGMDVGFELAVVFALVVYIILRPIELAQDKKRTFGEA